MAGTGCFCHRQPRASPLKPAPLSEGTALVEIKPLKAAAPAAVEALLDAAFGSDRHGRTAYRLRAGCRALAALSFSAWDGDALVGTLQCWPVAWASNDARVPMVMVGPVAVMPDVQRGGIGRALMDACIVAADGGGDGALMMIGDPDYYGRFWGFTADATAEWSIDGPVERHRLLARGANGHRVPVGPGAIVPDGARND